jgi:stearoyl-CoA desaturase (delta-9 desaturase)
VPARQRIGNLIGVLVPFIGVGVALALAWERLVGPTDVAILAAMYVATALGTSIGFHRLLTHRSFETYRPIKYAFAVLGTLSVEGSVTRWVATHRAHHAFADADGDPHSPHSPHAFGTGLGATLRGLWHAHVGWLLTRGHSADPARFARDLVEDRGMVIISRAFPAIVAAGLMLPFALGWFLEGSLRGGVTAAVCGGLVRIFLWHQVSFGVNSLCHSFGRRRFATGDRSTNLFWLALPSMGDAWHHNHHAFPRSARHGFEWWQLDVSALVIAAMRRMGLAWNVIEIPPDRVRQKEAVPLT